MSALAYVCSFYRQGFVSALLCAAVLLLASCDALRNGNGAQGVEQNGSAQSGVGQENPGTRPPNANDGVDADGGDGDPLGQQRFDDDKVRVALLLPLSGRLEQLGEAMLNAAELALFDNADARFELRPYDTQGNADRAASAARAAIQDRASLILGPLLASSVRRVSPEAFAVGIPVIAFSNNRSVAGTGTFLMGFTPSTEVEHIVAHAAQSGITRIVAIAPDNAYGSIIGQTLRRSASTFGLTVAHIELFDPAARDYNGTVQRAVTALPTQQAAAGQLSFGDALMLAEGGQNLLSLVSYLRINGVDPQQVQLLGPGAWDDPTLGREEALIGGRYAAPDPRFRRRFEDRFRTAFGMPAPRLTTLAYDAVALAASMARGGETNPFRTERITDPQGFLGRDGLFRFRTDGVPERSLAIQEVRRGGNQVIEESLARFPGS